MTSLSGSHRGPLGEHVNVKVKSHESNIDIMNINIHDVYGVKYLTHRGLIINTRAGRSQSERRNAIDVVCVENV